MAHRYWRIYCDDFDYDYVSLGELEFRTSEGGSQAATGGTALSGGDFSTSFPAAEAFNGTYSTTDDNDGWASVDEATTAWLGYDFGSGNDVDIIEVALYPRHLNPLEAPPNFYVQYSDNGSDWTTEWFVGVTYPLDDTLAVFSKSATIGNRETTKIRFIFNATQDAVSGSAGYVSIAEMELRQSTSGVDETTNTGGTVLFSDEYNSTTLAAANIVNDSASSAWVGYLYNFTSGFNYIGFEFDSAVTIREYTFTARTISAGLNPTRWAVQVWDGSDWQDVVGESTTGDWVTGETRTFTLLDASIGEAASISANAGIDTFATTVGAIPYDDSLVSAVLGISTEGAKMANGVTSISAESAIVIDGDIIPNAIISGTMPDLQVDLDFGNEVSFAGDLPELDGSFEFGIEASFDADLPDLNGLMDLGLSVDSDLPDMQGSMIVAVPFGISGSLPYLAGSMDFGMAAVGGLPNLEGSANIPVGLIVSGSLTAISGEMDFGLIAEGQLVNLTGSANVSGVLGIDSSLPSVDGSMDLGLRIEGTLYSLEGSADVTTLFEISNSLPELSGSAEFAFVADSDLADLQGSIELDQRYDFEVTLPSLDGSLELVSVFDIVGTLPEVNGSMVLDTYDYYEISGNLPQLSGSLLLEDADNFTITGNLPSLDGSAEIEIEQTMVIDGSLPPLDLSLFDFSDVASVDLSGSFTPTSDDIIRHRRGYDNG